MTSTTADVTYTPAPSADFVLPFELPALGLRGRLIRLDSVSSRALSAHPLPEPAQRVLAEALVLAALLGSALKFEGRLSVQLKGNGPLDLLVTDYFAGAAPGGGLRGYARLDEQNFAASGQPANFAKLAGSGALAITIEPKKGAQTYQGLVPLSPDGLSASAETYFFQSEQLPTALRLSAGPTYRSGEGRGWRAGALMVQAVPGREADRDKTSDDWQRIALFLKTLEDYELLDTAISAESVLWRLFHEDEVRVHPSQTLRFECSCRAGEHPFGAGRVQGRGAEGPARSRRRDPHALRILRHRLRISRSRRSRSSYCAARCATRRRNAAQASSWSSATNSSALCASIDRARSAHDRRNSGLLEQSRFGAVGHRVHVVAAGERAGEPHRRRIRCRAPARDRWRAHASRSRLPARPRGSAEGCPLRAPWRGRRSLSRPGRAGRGTPTSRVLRGPARSPPCRRDMTLAWIVV